MAMSDKKFFKVAEPEPVEEEPMRIVTPKELKERVEEDPTEALSAEELCEYLGGYDDVETENAESTPVADETETVEEVDDDTTEETAEISDVSGADPDETPIYTSNEAESDDVVADAAENSEDEAVEGNPDAPETLSPKRKQGKFSPALKVAAATVGVLVLAGGITAASMLQQPSNDQMALSDNGSIQSDVQVSAKSVVDSALSRVDTIVAGIPAEAEASEVDTTVDTEPEVTWSTRYVLINHPAETHTVTHPTTYEMVTEYHTVCNVCKEEIDGKTEQHKTQTGHDSYSTNVPIEREHVKTQSWSETVVDKEAYSELVEDGEKSSDGQVRNNKYNDDGSLK